MYGPYTNTYEYRFGPHEILFDPLKSPAHPSPSAAEFVIEFFGHALTLQFKCILLWRVVRASVHRRWPSLSSAMDYGEDIQTLPRGLSIPRPTIELPLGFTCQRTPMIHNSKLPRTLVRCASYYQRTHCCSSRLWSRPRRFIRHHRLRSWWWYFEYPNIRDAERCLRGRVNQG